LSKKEALANAYNFLQLENGASKNQIDSNFERLALEYHPDKDGNNDDLLKLSLSKRYIQMSKGEWF
jgi:curved DNA-binding protein CbpA